MAPTSGGSRPGQEWREQITVTSDKLVSTVKKLYQDGKVQRVIIRGGDGRELVSMPLNPALAVGGVVALSAPVLAALAGVAALVSKVHLEVVRVDQAPPAGERIPR